MTLSKIIKIVIVCLAAVVGIFSFDYFQCLVVDIVCGHTFARCGFDPGFSSRGFSGWGPAPFCRIFSFFWGLSFGCAVALLFTTPRRIIFIAVFVLALLFLIPSL